MNSILKIAEPPFELKAVLQLPLFESHIPAGFPSPADDYIDKKLSLDEHFIQHPAATYFARARGDSMKQLGILDGALLIVDRSLMATQGDIVVAAIDGEFTCKQLDIRNRRLVAANPKYPPIVIREGMNLEIEGVVTHWINSSRR